MTNGFILPIHACRLRWKLSTSKAKDSVHKQIGELVGVCQNTLVA